MKPFENRYKKLVKRKIDKNLILPKCSGKMDQGYIRSRYKIKN